jgi:hypothetical protein
MVIKTMYREKKKCIDGLGNYNDFLVVSVMSDSTRDSGKLPVWWL